jgi:hypothetical protein
MTTVATSITVRVPIAVRRRGGRKVIITPDGVIAPGAGAVQTRGDPTPVKALARAHRWRRLLERGRYRSLRELAAAEGVDRVYIARMLQLTLLAPDYCRGNPGREAAGQPRATAVDAPLTSALERATLPARSRT